MPSPGSGFMTRPFPGGPGSGFNRPVQGFGGPGSGFNTAPFPGGNSFNRPVQGFTGGATGFYGNRPPQGFYGNMPPQGFVGGPVGGGPFGSGNRPGFGFANNSNPYGALLADALTRNQQAQGGQSQQKPMYGGSMMGQAPGEWASAGNNTMFKPAPQQPPGGYQGKHRYELLGQPFRGGFGNSSPLRRY